MDATSQCCAWLLRATQVMHDANMRKLLPKITCPALLAVGETEYRSGPEGHVHPWHARHRHPGQGADHA